MDTLLEALGIYGPVASFIGVILASAWVMDRYQLPASRVDLAQYLAGISKGNDLAWYQAFISSFDRLFEQKSRSILGHDVVLLSYRRVLVVSVFSVFFLCLIWFAFFHPKGFHGFELGRNHVLSIILVTVTFNTAIDYISTLQTRWVIGKLNTNGGQSKNLGWTTVVGWLALDLMATTFVVVLSWFLLAFSFNFAGARDAIVDLSDMSIWGAAALVVKNFLIAMVGLPSLVAMYFDTTREFNAIMVLALSTFLTSIWLWVFLIGIIGVRFLSAYGRVFSAVARHFRLRELLEEHPIMLIGYTAAGVIILGVLSTRLMLVVVAMVGSEAS